MPRQWVRRPDPRRSTRVKTSEGEMNSWDNDVKRHLALGVPLNRIGRGPTMSRRHFGGMVGLVTLVAACGQSENGGSSTGGGATLSTIQVGTESLDAEQWA